MGSKLTMRVKGYIERKRLKYEWIQLFIWRPRELEMFAYQSTTLPAIHKRNDTISWSGELKFKYKYGKLRISTLHKKNEWSLPFFLLSL